MKISQTQRQVITEGIKSDKSIPKIAGELSSHTTNDRGLSDLIGMINKVKKTYNESDESERSEKQNSMGENELDSDEQQGKSPEDSSDIEKDAYKIDNDELESDSPVLNIVDNEE